MSEANADCKFETADFVTICANQIQVEPFHLICHIPNEFLK